jgi:hypothetical protein
LPRKTPDARVPARITGTSPKNSLILLRLFFGQNPPLSALENSDFLGDFAHQFLQAEMPAAG